MQHTSSSASSAETLAAVSVRHRATQRAEPTSAPAKVVAGGGGQTRRVQQGSGRKLVASKELFFAGFPCIEPYRRQAPGATKPSTTPALAATYSKQFVRGFFQQYGAVEALFYDEKRGMGSVVFADGADAESCYLAVHLSFIAAPDENGGMGQPTWERDRQTEALDERKARALDLLLCLEFAQCCPFVHPCLLTRDAFLVGGEKEWEVPGGELSRALLLHKFPVLLLSSDSRPSATEPMVPVAPHVVVRWEAETVEAPAPRVEVVEDGDRSPAAAAHSPETVPSPQSRRVKRVGPTFPGRGIEPAVIEEALWQILQPAHVAPQDGNVVTVMDMWWEYYNLYALRKTQPSADRIADDAFLYAAQPSLAQEVREVQRQSREYAHGDEAAAQQVMMRLVHDNVYHSALSYLCVKQKLKCDPMWASLMRDLYNDKVVLHVQAWRALAETAEAAKQGSAVEGGVHNAKLATTSLSSSTATGPLTTRRGRAVKAALKVLYEPQPTKQEDIEALRATEQLWRTMPRTEAAANLIENVKLLEKIKRGLVDRNGHDKVDTRPPLPALSPDGGGGQPPDMNMEAAYPTMSAAQRDEQLYLAVMQNVDGYVETGTADELVSLCEHPKLFRYVKGHIGYEEAHRLPSYWRAYLNALWVPLIAFLLLGFGTYYMVDWLGINEAHEKAVAERQRREFHAHLLHLLNQQQAFLDQNVTDGAHLKATLQALNETMRRTSEAAARAGKKFHIELKQDL
ncbi:conserved hypothetical protein [Leishmania major strain Friedlin]|uniref:Uncharacterized protein n=1 Tax=Leishmania major TaxID=5664 RepID=Q4QHQ9_LEIMA|nr:conserved hypothetical protein [Leishmania major strain Friedlin]CAG9569732.1 hypothetical_protein_-__conserved [Leishmania major strain Friedlin]CAJ02924.1 conserved hypothetical protein [Leishmania major strain Friedlin]|eukprot:XP_001681289.1 conserved hypothetical protein [Leishmania major strain Friedlin]